MFSINRKKIAILVFFFLNNILYSQVHIGINYGKNYDFGKSIPKQYLSNGLFDFILLYENKTLFNPFLSVGFTKIPLNYSTVLLKNQGNFKTVSINNATNFEIGLESKISKYEAYNLNAKFGIGISSFSNPLIWIEDSNTSFGYYSNYSSLSKKTFSFIDIGFKIERMLSAKWKLTLNLATTYYPSDRSLIIDTVINGNSLTVNSTFTQFRPYAKIGILFNLKKLNNK